MKKLIISALLLSISGAAVARNWYIFDVGNLSCLNAKAVAQEHGQPEFATPYAFRQAARHLSTYGGTRVYHYADGQMGVVISAMHRSMYFLSSRSTCRIFKHVYTSNGHNVSNLNQLK